MTYSPGNTRLQRAQTGSRYLLPQPPSRSPPFTFTWPFASVITRALFFLLLIAAAICRLFLLSDLVRTIRIRWPCAYVPIVAYVDNMTAVTNPYILLANAVMKTTEISVYAYLNAYTYVLPAKIFAFLCLVQVWTSCPVAYQTNTFVMLADPVSLSSFVVTVNSKGKKPI